MSDFLGNWFRRNESVDVTGVLTFICHRMRDSKDFKLAYVLHTIIKTVFGWKDLEVELLK
jgi:hypothetical protein